MSISLCLKSLKITSKCPLAYLIFAAIISCFEEKKPDCKTRRYPSSIKATSEELVLYPFNTYCGGVSGVLLLV